MIDRKRILSGALTVLLLCSIGVPVLADELPGEEPGGPVCTCRERCEEDAPNPACPVCAEDWADCTAAPVEDAPTEDPPAEDAPADGEPEVGPAGPVCVCDVRCGEDAPNTDCPVCAANPADCAAKADESVGATLAVRSNSAAAYKARIGEVPYPTLMEAIAAVQDGETITLLDDVTDEAIVIAPTSRMAFTLDLAGKTISQGGFRYEAIQIDKPVDLTITGKGTMAASNSCIYIHDTGLDTVLTIENGVFSAEAYCIQVTSTYDTENRHNFITVKNGDFEAKTCVYTGHCSTLLIQDGEFHSKRYEAIGTGEYSDSHISGGTFTSDNDVNLYLDGPATITGGTFISGRYEAASLYNRVTITGGSFAGTDCAVCLLSDEPVTLSGGTFTAGEPNPALEVYEGYTGTFIVADGYHAEPADWKTASVVKIVPDEAVDPAAPTPGGGESGTESEPPRRLLKPQVRSKPLETPVFPQEGKKPIPSTGLG